jgi:hypothetical protein
MNDGDRTFVENLFFIVASLAMLKITSDLVLTRLTGLGLLWVQTTS